MKKFENKIVYVVGGSQGIGFAIAKQIVMEGGKVAIFARNLQNLEHAIIQLNSIINNNVCFALDATNFDDTINAFQQANSKIGTPDFVINCAGMARPEYFENITFNQFEHTIKTNLYTTWNVSKAAIPLLKKTKGYLLNTSSIAGFLGVFGYSDYAMTKFGIVGFSETIQQEVEKYGISVGVLYPPDTDTPGFDEENKTKPQETKIIGGSAKLLSADDVAKYTIMKIAKRKKIIIPGFDGKVTYILKRFLPNVVNYILKNKIKGIG